MNLNRNWQPLAVFPHARHGTVDCGECHDKANSNKSEDMSFPGIKKCRECHGGGRGPRGKSGPPARTATNSTATPDFPDSRVFPGLRCSEVSSRNARVNGWGGLGRVSRLLLRGLVGVGPRASVHRPCAIAFRADVQRTLATCQAIFRIPEISVSNDIMRNIYGGLAA